MSQIGENNVNVNLKLKGYSRLSYLRVRYHKTWWYHQAWYPLTINCIYHQSVVYLWPCPLAIEAYTEFSTVGSRLSKPRLSVSRHLDVGSRRHVFGLGGKNMLRSLEFCSWRNKAALRTTFLNAATLFPSSMGFSSQFTTSELTERSCECCSTLYYSVAN